MRLPTGWARNAVRPIRTVPVRASVAAANREIVLGVRIGGKRVAHLDGDGLRIRVVVGALDANEVTARREVLLRCRQRDAFGRGERLDDRRLRPPGRCSRACDRARVAQRCRCDADRGRGCRRNRTAARTKAAIAIRRVPPSPPSSSPSGPVPVSAEGHVRAIIQVSRATNRMVLRPTGGRTRPLEGLLLAGRPAWYL